MSGPRLRYILGGAVLGALLGAVYANYLYAMYGKKEDTEIIVPNHTATAADEIIENAVEPERAASAAVQRRAAKSREVTDSDE